MLSLLTSLAAAADPVPAVWTADWWSEFLRSPGFAGSLAVLAAALGLAGVAWNTRATRKARERDRWWEMFQRVSDDLATYDERRATMVMEALRDQARTVFEQQMVATLIDQVLPPATGGGGGYV